MKSSDQIEYFIVINYPHVQQDSFSHQKAWQNISIKIYQKLVCVHIPQPKGEL